MYKMIPSITTQNFKARFSISIPVIGGKNLSAEKKTYTVAAETFNTITSYRCNQTPPLNWDCLFVIPEWLNAWRQSFGLDSELYIRSIHEEGEMIGIAPLRVRGDEAYFIGDIEVCDYQDFIIVSGKETTFFECLLDHLIRHKKISRLHLQALRPDSSVMTHLTATANRFNRSVSCTSQDVSLELELPDSWDAFLAKLTGKQRHEMRRKLRRLYEAGRVRFRVADGVEEIREQMKTFLTLFKSNRFDKASFMNDQMAQYFQLLTGAMAGVGILKLFFLDIDDQPAAAALCFDYQSRRYLYNNGYDHRFSPLSVGLICKMLSIKDAIENGKKIFDFLKGAEPYKHRLGGKPVSLHRCIIDL
jgi:CelD/BcsL family acetyltransferase involved in cellulose biosynthesis